MPFGPITTRLSFVPQLLRDYGPNDPNIGHRSWRKPLEDLAAKVAAAQPTTDAEVKALIGDYPGRSPFCDNCESHVDATIQVGQEMGEETYTADLCASCLRAAFALLESHS